MHQTIMLAIRFGHTDCRNVYFYIVFFDKNFLFFIGRKEVDIDFNYKDRVSYFHIGSIISSIRSLDR